MKRTSTLFSVIVILACLSAGSASAAVVNHDISSRSLEIPGSSTDDYVVTGSTTRNYIRAEFGYKGTITLKNCSFRFTSYGSESPIRIVGRDNMSNTDPSRTNVNLILDGTNTIYNYGYGRAGIQVDQGAQINISAIEQCDNTSGTLTITQASDDGGAAIGSLNHSRNSNETTSTAILSDGYMGTTAGGNIVISSGTITCHGGHGAGIGGGFRTYYDGMIVIYGGVIKASSVRHSAGIGSGCPTGIGVVDEYTPNSAVVVLPPAAISATGAGGSSGEEQMASLGLAGTNVRVYIGDPEKPAIRVSTVDHLPNANIYFDLSQDPDINRVITTTISSSILNVNNVLLGQTDASGVFATTGSLTNPTTFFTDASSTYEATAGNPYVPITQRMPNGGTVEFPLLETKIGISLKESKMLETGYTNRDAQKAAAIVKVVYNDPSPMTSVTFDLASGETTPFGDLIFLGADSATVIPAPTTLNQGDVFYVFVPAKLGLEAKVHSDVLRMSGIWKGSDTGYIRQVISQVVTDVQPVYICEGESYYFNGEYLTEPGIYTEVSSSSSTCAVESNVTTIKLIIDSPKYIKEAARICSGESYTWYGEKLTKGGTYTRNLKTATGACDSILELELIEYKTYLNTQKASVCQGEKYYFAGRELTTSGTYYDSLQTINGCDSVTKLVLTVNPTYLFEDDAEICDDEVFTFRGKKLYQTGTYFDSLKTKAGCDSIYKLNLVVHPTYFFPTVETTCDNHPYTYRGKVYNETGVYYDSLTTAFGCDSIYRLDLTVYPSYSFEESATICDYEKYKFQGRLLNKTGVYVDTIPTVHGCDSVYTLHLQATPTKKDSINVSICLDDYYLFGGNKIYEDGVYRDTLTDPQENGCEIHTLRLRTVASTIISRARVDDACADSTRYQIKYHYNGPAPISYSLYYDDYAKEMGFEDVLDAPFTGYIYDNIPQFPGKEYLKPDIYHVRLEFNNGVCNPGESAFDLSFMIKYPSWILEQNWNDVVAVLNENYNGGYKFKQFDWYVNNREHEHDAKSYIYTPHYLHTGDLVYAQLTRSEDDYAICTCPLMIRDKSNSYASDEPVLVAVNNMSKMLTIAVQKPMSYMILSASGIVMQSGSIETAGTTIIPYSLPSGLYVIVFTEGNTVRSYKFTL